MRNKLCFLLLLFVTFIFPMQGQIQNNALLRVFMLRVGNFTGSGFTLERGGKQYLITAKHLVNSLPQKGATIEVYGAASWEDLKVNIITCKSPDVDIAALELEKPISVSFELEPSTKGMVFGQDAYMLGYPFGLHPLAMGGKTIPFIKRVTVSSMDQSNKDSVVWYFDGFNNPGFSGGPVVYWDRNNPNKMKVAAIISGYRPDTAEAVVNGQQVSTNILVNSGIVIAYDIQHALDAIDASPGK
jgi:hypothetical protein